MARKNRRNRENRATEAEIAAHGFKGERLTLCRGWDSGNGIGNVTETL